MIRLGCYEFIVCKGNVFKRIRKTKTHACLCCRAAVSFCNVAPHLHLVIRLCANWAAVRQPVQALHGVIRLRANWAAVRQPVQARLRSPCTNCPASEPESWVASCGVLHYANRPAGVHPRLHLPGSRVGARDDGALRRLCHRAPLHCRPAPPRCHSGLRAGILGGLMRSIALHCRLAIVHPRQRLPRPRVGARGDGANAPFVPSCPSALPPRTPTVSFRA